MDKQYNTYNIDLDIYVERNYICAKTSFLFNCNLPSIEVLKFYIYKDLELNDIVCDREIKYKVGKEIEQWSPFVLESKLVEITFTEPVRENDCVKIDFSYEGHIGIVTQYGVNRLTRDWIELGIYTPWFPLTETLEEAIFHVNIEIDNQYRIINAREFEKHQIINSTTPDVDCCIIASNAFQFVKSNFNDIDVHVYFTMDKYRECAVQISNYSSAILERYRRFGQIDNQELSIVLAPREDGGGYCRHGLIVLTPDDYQEADMDFFMFVAHELAHLWWCKSKKPDTWEDWLNESFAQYSALIALRDYFGEDEFNNKINAYAQKIKGLPPIKDIDRNHENAYEVLYIKGPLILNELEKTVGKDKFEELLMGIFVSDICTTENF